MWINDHPYLSFYLAGCILVVVLTFIKIVLFKAIDWIIKANILNKNLKKVLPPDEHTVITKIARFFGVLIAETVLSWINVIVIIWQLFSGVFRVLRDLFTPAPEEIKTLRFPLRNNPSMSRESVWAYLLALRVKAGEEHPSVSQLITMVDEVAANYPSFDRIGALNQLESLRVISSESISSAIRKSANHDEL